MSIGWNISKGMAMKFIDGFDHYFYSPTAKKKWDDLSGYTIAAPGRFGYGNKMRPGGSGNLFQSYWVGASKTTHPAGTSKIITGAALRFDSNIATSVDFHPFLAIRGDNLRHQVQFFMERNTGRIRCGLADPSWPITVGGTDPTTIPPTWYADTDFVPPFGLWFFFEVAVSVAGTVDIYVDSELLTSMSGLTTLNGGATSYIGVRWMALAKFNAGYDIDDLYIADGTGSHVNNPIGESRIEYVTATAEGDVNDWTPSVGTDNALNVDGTTQFIENSPAPLYVPQYNISDVLNAVDLYQHADFTRDGTIYAVQVNTAVRKDDVGNRKVKPLLKTGGTTYEGAEAKLYSDYIYVGEIWPQNPNTLADWTLSQVNAVQTGIKITV